MNLSHMKAIEKRAALEAQHLLGLGKTDDIANACIFLLSDASLDYRHKPVCGRRVFCKMTDSPYEYNCTNFKILKWLK